MLKCALKIIGLIYLNKYHIKSQAHTDVPSAILNFQLNKGQKVTAKQQK